MKNKIYEKNAIKWSNVYYECDNYIVLNIFKAETNESYDILIDKEDFDLVKQGHWYVSIYRKNTHLKNIINIIWTTSKNGKSFSYQIYQWILDTKHKGVIVDHINMNRLDNRKQNLRIVSGSDNATNQEHKGYYFEKSTNKYLVRVRIGKNDINVGRYKTESEAEIMYLKCSLLLHKENISYSIKERINKLNIKLTDEDYKNKYIIKLINILDGKHDFTDTKNGRSNPAYDENIELIYNLVSSGNSYYKVSKILRDMKIEGLEHARDEMIKRRYLEYIEKAN